jgi:phosphoribosylaminoimidazole-succinocarboxamide synthase
MKKIYEGKAKTLFTTSNPEELICLFKDSVTAGNGLKKDEITGKGELNNKITELIFQYLEKKGIETHFIRRISEHEQLLKKLTIIPLEVIVRNVSAGHFSSRYDVKEGFEFKNPVFELSYKRDDLGDPLLNEDHAVALEIITKKEFEFIKNQALIINDLLIALFLKIKIKLVDFKLEFGKLPNGQIILADEFSPDNSRL